MSELSRYGSHGRKFISPELGEQVNLQRNVMVGSVSAVLHKWGWRIGRIGRPERWVWMTIEERAPTKSEECLYKLK